MRLLLLIALFLSAGHADPSLPLALAGTEQTKPSQKNEKPQGWDLGTARARIDAVRAEIDRLGDHQWAGAYYMGDGLGVNVSLNLAPESGFTFVWTGCLGIYDYNYGPIEEREDGLLVLRPQLENDRRGFQGTATEFYPVRWGARRYLLPKDELIEFANAVNSGEAASPSYHGRFLVGVTRDTNPDGGLPPVMGIPTGPKGLRDKVFEEPLVARITPTGERKIGPALVYGAKTPVRIEAGAKSGIFVGMELFPLVGSGLDKVVVTDVQPESATGVLYQCRIGEEEWIPLERVTEVSSRSRLYLGY
jgi:hypothetical protein